jgi:hypothetical protein
VESNGLYLSREIAAVTAVRRSPTAMRLLVPARAAL